MPPYLADDLSVGALELPHAGVGGHDADLRCLTFQASVGNVNILVSHVKV